jgi:hypothetical protein
MFPYGSVALKDPHYSEELIFFSPCGPGWVVLTAQHITHSGTYHHGELELRVPGIPVDIAPYRSFCEAIGASFAFFTPLSDSDHRRAFFETGRAPRLKAPVLVIDRHGGEDWVTGLFVENPFRTQEPNFRNGNDQYEVLRDLRAPDLVYVKLLHHHLAKDVVDYYEVTSVEAVTLGIRAVIRVCANWHRMLKSTWKERERSTRDENWAAAVSRAARAMRRRSKRTGRFVRAQK